MQVVPEEPNEEETTPVIEKIEKAVIEKTKSKQTNNNVKISQKNVQFIEYLLDKYGTDFKVGQLILPICRFLLPITHLDGRGCHYLSSKKSKHTVLTLLTYL